MIISDIQNIYSKKILPHVLRSFLMLNNLSTQPLPNNYIFWIPSEKYAESDGWMVNPNYPLLKTNNVFWKLMVGFDESFPFKKWSLLSTGGDTFSFILFGWENNITHTANDLMHPNKQTYPLTAFSGRAICHWDWQVECHHHLHWERDGFLAFYLWGEGVSKNGRRCPNLPILLVPTVNCWWFRNPARKPPGMVLKPACK